MDRMPEPLEYFRPAPEARSIVRPAIIGGIVGLLFAIAAVSWNLSAGIRDEDLRVKILFPLELLIARRWGGNPILALVTLEYPVFGILCGKALIRNRWKPVFAFAVVHALGVAACLL